ncbi:MAG: hypothetical protein ACP5KK_03230 [Candidatus Nanoarchaeia archaeon]
MNKQNCKKGAADMLLELVFSTIIFFLVVVFLFGVKGPSLKINAHATVISADAAYSCEISLINLLRTTSNLPDITYGEWLSYSGLDGDWENWKGNVTSLLDNGFGNGNWNLTVIDYTGTKIKTFGSFNPKDKIKGKEYFSCSAYVPIKPNELGANCNWSGTEEGSPGVTVKFSTPDGDCNVILETSGKIGVSKCKDICTCDKKPSVEDDPDTLDFVEAKVSMNNIPYVLYILETDETNNKVNVTLSKRAKIDECAYLVNLLVKTNVLKEMAAEGAK